MQDMQEQGEQDVSPPAYDDGMVDEAEEEKVEEIKVPAGLSEKIPVELSKKIPVKLSEKSPAIPAPSPCRLCVRALR